jgi:hypothetical protein
VSDAVAIIAAWWILPLLLSFVAWLKLRAEDRERRQRIGAVREQLRRETLAHALRQPVA